MADVYDKYLAYWPSKSINIHFQVKADYIVRIVRTGECATAIFACERPEIRCVVGSQLYHERFHCNYRVQLFRLVAMINHAMSDYSRQLTGAVCV